MSPSPPGGRYIQKAAFPFIHSDAKHSEIVLGLLNTNFSFRKQAFASLQYSWAGPKGTNLPRDNGPSKRLAAFDGILMGSTAQGDAISSSWDGQAVLLCELSLRGQFLARVHSSYH